MSNIKVTLGLDGAGFQSGLRQAGAAVNNWAGGLKSQIGAIFTAGAISAFTKRTIDFAGSMRDLGDRLGVNVEWLQKMNNAIRQAGGSADDLANFMNKVSEAREAALTDPKGKEAKAFTRAGITSTDLSGLSAQQFADKFIAAFAGSLSVQMENDLTAIGGKSAKKLLAAFSQGIDSTGPIIPEDIIDQLDDLGDAFYIFEQGAMKDLAPAIVGVANFFKDLADGIRLFAVTVGGAIGGAFSGKGATQSALEAQNELANEILAREKRASDLRATLKANRRQRESSPPGFDITPKTDAVKADPKAARATDALVSVGNFLGAGRSSIDTIAKETNAILKLHTSLLRQVVSNTGKSGLGINVPAN